MIFFIIVLINMKYWGVNFIKMNKNLYIENYKILIKDIKEFLNGCRDMLS